MHPLKSDWRPLLERMEPGQEYSEHALLSLLNIDRETDHFDARDLLNILRAAAWRVSARSQMFTRSTFRNVVRLSDRYLKELAQNAD